MLSISDHRTDLVWTALGVGLMLPLAAAATASAAHPGWAMAGAALALLALGATLVAPAWGALALIAVVYSNASDVLNDQFGMAWLLRGLLAWTLLAWALARWRRGGAPPRWPLARPLAAYGLVLLLALPGARHPGLVLQEWVEFLKAVAIFYLVVNLLGRPRAWRHGLTTIVSTVGLMALPVVYQGLTGSQFTFWGFAAIKRAGIIGEEFGNRLAGPIGDPNFFALVLVAALPLAVMGALAARSAMTRLWHLWGLLGGLAAVALSYSRASLLGLLFLVAALAGCHRRRRLILAGSLLALLALVRAMPADYRARMLTLGEVSVGGGQQQVVDPSYRGRRGELYIGLAMVRAHPFLGVGPGNYTAEYQTYNARVGLDSSHEDHEPHNLFLQIAAETGLIGLAAFLALVLPPVVQLFRAVGTLRRGGAPRLAEYVLGLATGLGAYLLLSLFLHGAYFRHFMVLLALGAVTLEWLPPADSGEVA